MRIGSDQYFVDFLQNFEYKLAQYNGLAWPDNAKIIRLNSAINAKLADALITVDLPDDNYMNWVQKVKRISEQLKAKEGYRRNEGHTIT